MNIKSSVEVLERAEKAGLRIVVDGEQWDGPAADFPLDSAISPVRCDLVEEARRIANLLQRPASPPEGSVYRHPKEALEAALKRAVAYIRKQGGESDAETPDSPGEGSKGGREKD